jgi:hypothetical protein
MFPLIRFGLDFPSWAGPELFSDAYWPGGAGFLSQVLLEEE